MINLKQRPVDEQSNSNETGFRLHLVNGNGNGNGNRFMGNQSV